MCVLRRHQKPPEFFCPHRSPESCLENAPRSLGATAWLAGRLLGLHRRALGLAVPEAFAVEGLFLPQHVIDSPAQPRRQDAQGLGLAVPFFLASQETLGLVAFQ